MDEIEEFEVELKNRVKKSKDNAALQDTAQAHMLETIKEKYSYNFKWLGRPIIQYPADIVALQEIIWKVKPDLIVETGIAHGGSIIFSASMLCLLELSGYIKKGEVLGIDIDIRDHNRREIEKHPLTDHIRMIEGSSIDERVVEEVRRCAKGKDRILVCLDSNHTHKHVLVELNAYAPLVTVGSYCIVFDTIIEKIPEDVLGDRPWDHNNNPATATREFLRTHSTEFAVDYEIESKLLLTTNPGGYLKRISHRKNI